MSDVLLRCYFNRVPCNYTLRSASHHGVDLDQVLGCRWHSAVYDLAFDASFAADIISPVTFFMCSPAFVNWLFKNSDWIWIAS
jgi:hypothetical protein